MDCIVHRFTKSLTQLSNFHFTSTTINVSIFSCLLATKLLSCKMLIDAVITHLEPDILGCEIKWALGSITTNKASGVMEFQLSYLQMML